MKDEEPTIYLVDDIANQETTPEQREKLRLWFTELQAKLPPNAKVSVRMTSEMLRFQDELTVLVAMRETFRRVSVEDEDVEARIACDYIENHKMRLLRAFQATLRKDSLVCPDCGESGGAPVHPDQPCCTCGRTCFDTD
jgi:hypothetical protein